MGHSSAVAADTDSSTPRSHGAYSAVATTARSTNRQRATLLVASMASFMAGLDALVVTTALPTIHAHFNASPATLSWMVSAYSLAFAALILTGTTLGDRLGHRRVFLVGLAGFTMASAACAVSPTAGLLVAARAVQGACAGLAMPLSLVLINQAYPPERRGAVVGIWGAITGLAVGIGPLIGGAIVQRLAWQWVFWVNVPIGALILTVGASRLTESRGATRRLDPLGLVLAAAAVFAVTDALLRAPQIGWNSAEVVALLVGGVVFAAAFLAWEHRTSQPMFPMALFANTAFTATVAARFALAASRVEPSGRRHRATRIRDLLGPRRLTQPRHPVRPAGSSAAAGAGGGATKRHTLQGAPMGA
jgi:EmrB/QacA subfamily drug resistance transporter